jgi:hypothetical protein
MVTDITVIAGVGDFEPAAIDDPDFKEDAVREEFTHPLLVRLGYASSGDRHGRMQQPPRSPARPEQQSVSVSCRAVVAAR